MNTNFTRRRMLGTTLAGMAAASLAACGSGGSGDSGLGLSWYGGDPVHEAMKKLVELYAEKHPDADITTQYSAFADYWDKLATQTAGRSAPDVMRMSMSYLSDYADRGALADLSQYVGDTIDLGDQAPDVADSASLDGALYGVGQSSIALAAFVDRELIAQAGAPDVDESWTWDSFAAWAKDLGGSSGDLYGSMDQGGSFQLFEAYVREAGTEVFTDDGAGLAFDRAVLEQWWEYWHDMRAHRGAPPASVSAEVASFDTWPIAKGLTPVGFGFVQQIAFLQPYVDRPLDILTPPTTGGTSGLYVKSLDFWSIASTSSHQDEAAELVDFLVNDDEAITALGVVLGVPPSQRAIELLGLDPSTPEGKAVDYVSRISGSVPEAPPAWPVGYNELLTLFTKLNQDIGFEESSVADAVAAFFDAAEGALS
ncbi:extracellular solute-binding protein [Glycomyces sp. A-F 0318]|uniref:ABC transporter substrate-binding protein n=1 Tax=Glycomyces amatae TaxID=2881355 RepID=UPI001E42BF66|nr:extracellular solute-binding protein [Glycomyces amatae]MCD0447305.1 extracellular solute-binding protein [Glycomyces amatae]